MNNLPINIHDEPDFVYRGVMIDTSRHFLKISRIKEIIDGMMYSKLNALHWHITDDEYFGFGSEYLNNSTDNSDYVYSKSQIEDLILYAYTRGITVIPELDNPSHTRSWKSIDDQIVLTKPEYGNLDPSKNKTYEMVLNVLNESLKTFSKDVNTYFHLGGDEVLSEMWKKPEIRIFMDENNISNVTELENYYFNRIRKNLPDNNVI